MRPSAYASTYAPTRTCTVARKYARLLIAFSFENQTPLMSCREIIKSNRRYMFGFTERPL